MVLALLATTVAADPAAHEAAASGIGALGVDGKALLFQIVNFIILLVLLRIFAYPPITRVLEERRARIQEGLEGAAQMERAKADLHQEREAILQQAHEAARKVLRAGEEQAHRMMEEGLAQAREQAQSILNKGRAQLEQDVRAARSQLKHEVVSLTAAAAERVLQEKLDAPKDEDLIKRAVAQVS